MCFDVFNFSLLKVIRWSFRSSIFHLAWSAPSMHVCHMFPQTLWILRYLVTNVASERTLQFTMQILHVNSKMFLQLEGLCAYDTEKFSILMPHFIWKKRKTCHYKRRISSKYVHTYISLWEIPHYPSKVLGTLFESFLILISNCIVVYCSKFNSQYCRNSFCSWYQKLHQWNSLNNCL